MIWVFSSARGQPWPGSTSHGIAVVDFSINRRNREEKTSILGLPQRGSVGLQVL